jgi:hypothetical protein
VACIWWTLRTLSRVSERSLLAGELTVSDGAGGSAKTTRQRALFGAIGFALLAAALLAGTLGGVVGRTGAFFGVGTSLLAACLCLVAFALRRPARPLLRRAGWRSISRLGLRSATHRPGRSVLSIAVIASAAFILVSVDAFRQDELADVSDPHSGAGGYALIVESQLPIVHDPNSPEGRQTLGLDSVDGVTIAPFRLLPGDDASCLNLYEPRNPRILGAKPEFVASGRFRFDSALATSDAERQNPWLLLQRDGGDGTIPVIADGNSMTYVLHRGLGEEIVLNNGGVTRRLRLVAALADSIFQGELVMSERNFLALFPEQQGYRFLLVGAPSTLVPQISTTLEDRLGDLGADAVPTGVRLAQFHKVENTYLSTFQTLGGLGLALGTIGLSTVVLRNVLERRRDLALLSAVGYNRRHIFVMIVAENLGLLVVGLLAGAACALVAIAPAAADRGGRLPTNVGGWLLVIAVLVAGVVSSVVSTKVALNTSLVDALKAE